MQCVMVACVEAEGRNYLSELHHGGELVLFVAEMLEAANQNATTRVDMRSVRRQEIPENSAGVELGQIVAVQTKEPEPSAKNTNIQFIQGVHGAVST